MIMKNIYENGIMNRTDLLSINGDKELFPLVSIIIPIYNVDKKLLLNCVNSVLAQTYRNFELILVDDGSKDDLKKYCDELKQMDSRIKIIHQLNQGVSVARNNGTIASKGDYILYVDGDDLLAPIAVEEGIKIVIDRKVDVVFAGMIKLSSHDDFLFYQEFSDKYEVLKREEFREIQRHLFALDNKKYLNINGDGYITRGPVCRLIKREIALNNLFPIGISIGEDLIWNINLLEKCNDICIVYNIWYGYLKMPNSAIRGYHGDRIDLIDNYLSMLLDEHREFCLTNIDVFGKNIVVELYCILRYELMSEECYFNRKEKNRIVHEILNREPWCLIKNRRVIRYISLKYKLLLLSCKFNMWQTLLKIFIGREKK